MNTPSCFDTLSLPTPSAALPNLPIPESCDVLPIPILGQKGEIAARVLRALPHLHALPPETWRKTAGIHNSTDSPVGAHLRVLTCPDHTFLLASHHGTHLHVFPQPFIGAGAGDIRIALGALPVPAQAALAKAIATAPPTQAISSPPPPGHLWPTWRTLASHAVLNTPEVRALWKTMLWCVIHSLPALEDAPAHIDLVVKGRVLGFAGPGPASVCLHDVDFYGCGLDTHWIEAVEARASQVFSHPSILPPWASISQTPTYKNGTSFLKPGTICLVRVPLEHDRLTGHDRLKALASLPSLSV